MKDTHLCDYGCGQEATHQFQNGKWCCKTTYKSCPKVIEKTTKKITGLKIESISIINSDIFCEYGCGNYAKYKLIFKYSQKYCCSEKYSLCKSNIKTWNKGLTKENDHRVFKNSTNKNNYNKINYHLKHNKEFLKYEFLAEDPETHKLIVQCKLCEIKFIPEKRELEHRIAVIKKGELDKGIFYCRSCKKELLNKDKTDYFLYYNLVLKETERTVRKYRSKISNIELRGSKFGHDLDHQFSVNEGFKNNILPYVIAHWKNLRVIKFFQNRSKSKKCSISLEQLIRDIENSRD